MGFESGDDDMHDHPNGEHEDSGNTLSRTACGSIIHLSNKNPKANIKTDWSSSITSTHNVAVWVGPYTSGSGGRCGFLVVASDGKFTKANAKSFTREDGHAGAITIRAWS